MDTDSQVKKKEADLASKMVIDGYIIVNNHFDLGLKNFSPSEQDELKEEMNHWQVILSELHESPQKQEEISKAVLNGTPLKEVFHLSNRFVSFIYDIGKELFRDNRPEDAACVFFLLTDLVPQVSTFWRSLALSLHGSKRYRDAVRFYEKFFLFSDADKNLLPNLAEAYYFADQVEKAKKLLQDIKNDPDFKEHPRLKDIESLLEKS